MAAVIFHHTEFTTGMWCRRGNILPFLADDAL